jgi:hypothetical protein
MKTRHLFLASCLAVACQHQSVHTFSLPAFKPVTLSTTSAGVDAATITAGAPLEGLVIEVPANATTENVTFSVGYATIDDAALKLPSDAHVNSYLVQISTTGSDAWNQTRSFALPITVTLPYTPSNGVDEMTVDAYSVSTTGVPQAAGLAGSDRANHLVSFWLRSFTQAVYPAPPPSRFALSADAVQDAQTFATFVAAGIALNDKGKLGKALHGSDVLTIDTQFRPSKNGFYIPNTGTYLNTNGSCAGISSFALYDFVHFPGGNLFRTYRDPDDASTWVTDAGQIKLAAKGQKLGQYGTPFLAQDLANANATPVEIAYAILGGMYLGNQPLLLTLGSGKDFNIEGHDLLVYGANITASGTTLHIYDPNLPASDDVTQPMNPGATPPIPPYTQQGLNLDTYEVLGWGTFLADSEYAALKTQAEGSFDGDGTFATITDLTCTGWNTHNPCTLSADSDGTLELTSDDTLVDLTGHVGLPAAGGAGVIDSVSVMAGGDKVGSGILDGAQQFQAVQVPAPPDGVTLDLVIGFVTKNYGSTSYPWQVQNWAGMDRHYRLTGSPPDAGSDAAPDGPPPSDGPPPPEGPKLTITCPPPSAISTILGKTESTDGVLVTLGGSDCGYIASDKSGPDIAIGSGSSQSAYHRRLPSSSSAPPGPVLVSENIGVEATALTYSDTTYTVIYCYAGNGIWFEYPADSLDQGVALAQYLLGYVRGFLP